MRLNFSPCHPREAPEKFRKATKQEILPRVNADERKCSRGKPTIPAAITSPLQRFLKSRAASAARAGRATRPLSPSMRVHPPQKNSYLSAWVLHLPRESRKRVRVTLDVGSGCTGGFLSGAASLPPVWVESGPVGRGERSGIAWQPPSNARVRPQPRNTRSLVSPACPSVDSLIERANAALSGTSDGITRSPKQRRPSDAPRSRAALQLCPQQRFIVPGPLTPSGLRV
jgi:hypothetical protein